MAWDTLPTDAVIQDTVAALKKRGIDAEVVADKGEVLERLKALIPPGGQVMSGGSTTLDEIGLTPYLRSGSHPWRSMRDDIQAEKDPTKRAELRRKAGTSEYFLGSIHAIARTGEVVVVSQSGSQQGAYVYDSPHVIWVAGAQKIVPDLASALRRVREYCLPLEDQRVKKLGIAGSSIGKLLIFEQESTPHRITLILVKEKVGV
ncbi:MAG: lactate utilization protein [Chloroflexota bacterium]|nr:lactate utilization protein [Chloroflexota bacterium]